MVHSIPLGNLKCGWVVMAASIFCSSSRLYSCLESPGFISSSALGACWPKALMICGIYWVRAVAMQPMCKVADRPLASMSDFNKWACLTKFSARGNRLRQASVGLAEWALRDKRLVPNCASRLLMRPLNAAAVMPCLRAAAAIEPVSTTASRLSKKRVSIMFSYAQK